MICQADAVVVLGGIAAGSEHEITGLDFSARADRIMTGVELIRKEKSKVLVVGGGGYLQDGQWRSEADRLRPWMADWELLGGAGVEDLGVCGNTREEAVKFAKLVKERDWETVYLVTSANHMKRAEAVFLSAGVSVVPVMTIWDIRSGRWALIPSQSRMVGLRTWLYEKVGWAYYRSKGWICLEALPKETNAPNINAAWQR